MGNRKFRLHYHLVAIENDVYIDRTRTPVYLACPQKIILDHMDLVQKLERLNIRIESYAGVKEIRLILKAYRLCLIDRSSLKTFNSGKSLQSFLCSIDIGFPVTKIASQ